jgi:3-polyprenyl-4-hydroxybenzoate decarboxylase
MAAYAMWALECEIVPGEVAPDGPRQIVRVRRMHRRARPVFQTILPGMEAGNAFGLAAEARVLTLLQQQVPGVTAVHFTLGGGGLHQAVVQIAARRTGGSKQAILAAFAAFPPLTMVTVVDGDVDIRKAEDVAWAMATRFDAATGIVRIDDFGLAHESAVPGSIGAKLGFDATQPLPKRAGFERASFMPVALGEHEIAGIARPVAPEPARVTVPAQAAAVTPAASADWDENRWLQRELEAMRRDGNGTAAPGAKTAPAALAPVAPPAIADSAAAARKSKDWDEDRWLQRELEAMKRARAPKPVPRPAPPLRAAPPARPEPQRVAERPADDEDGSFFRGGAAQLSQQTKPSS